MLSLLTTDSLFAFDVKLNSDSEPLTDFPVLPIVIVLAVVQMSAFGW